MYYLCFMAKKTKLPADTNKRAKANPSEASWKERIVAYMKYANRAVTTNEISEAIAGVETHLPKAHVYSMVSGNMSSLVKDNHVKAFKLKKMKGQYYANPAWFDQTGNIMEKYKPADKDLGLWQ